MKTTKLEIATFVAAVVVAVGIIVVTAANQDAATQIIALAPINF
jgi:hypothetical protein